MTKPLRSLPHRFDAAALVEVMKQLGLPLPEGARLHASNGTRLSACGVTFKTAVIDEALAKTELSIESRIAVKIAIANAGLLGR